MERRLTAAAAVPEEVVVVVVPEEAEERAEPMASFLQVMEPRAVQEIKVVTRYWAPMASLRRRQQRTALLAAQDTALWELLALAVLPEAAALWALADPQNLPTYPLRLAARAGGA